MANNKVEAIKQAKHSLDVLEDIYRCAELGWEAIPEVITPNMHRATIRYLVR